MTTASAKAKEIFVELIGSVPPDQWEDRLVESVGVDEETLHRVRALLRAHANPGSFLAEPAIAVENHDSYVQLGAQIGPYKLREQLGEGGMGVVYVAEQTEPVKRKVALKIIKPGMDSAQVIARFEAERQVLAMMDHPNIARIIDAGTTDSGRSYFVMELVYGVPITEYCDQRQLTTQERLQLFMKVCRAIQHAHQKGIIHRDLKPSNVLVAAVDGEAVPKVIDFGVAKATGPKLTEETVYTQFSQIIGTPLYMSPEQAELGVADVDTRSDVYALGVLLYELLTGHTPFDSDTLKSAGFDEMRRIIREDEPPKPSAMVSTLKADALSTISQRRGSDPRKLSDAMQGELDWLVMKTLEKDRNRRYESASALAADVERYLNQETIAAGPPSLAYRFRKYAQRNKGKLIAASLTVAVLLIGVIAAGGAALQAQQQRREVTQAVLQLMAEARTAVEAGALSAAAERIAEARGRIDNLRATPVELLSSVDALGNEVATRREQHNRHEEFKELAQEALGNLVSGHEHLRRQGQTRGTQAIALYEVLTKDDWIETVKKSHLDENQQELVLKTTYELLLVLADYGVRWPDSSSIQSAEYSLNLLQVAAKSNEPTRAFHWVKGKCFDVLDNQELATQQRMLFEEKPGQLAIDYYLPGRAAGLRGDANEAIRSYEAALAIDPRHFNSLFYLALRLGQNNEHDRAIEVFRHCLALRPDDEASLAQLTGLLTMQERKAEALSLVNQRINRWPSSALYILRGRIHRISGQRDEALSDFSKAIELAATAQDPKERGHAYFRRGLILRDLGRHEEAANDIEDALELPADVNLSVLYGMLGELYLRLGNLQRSLEAHNQAIEVIVQESSPDHIPNGRETQRESILALYMNRSLTHLYLGNYELQLADLRELLTLDSENQLAYFWAAAVLADCPDLRQRDSSAALPFAEKASQLDPNDTTTTEVLALAQYRNGLFSEAIKTCSRLINHADEDGFAKMLTAMAYHHQGAVDQAQKWREEAEAEDWYQHTFLDWIDESEPIDQLHTYQVFHSRRLELFQAEAERVFDDPRIGSDGER